MRKVILSMQISLDGFVEGPGGAMDWFANDDEDQWKHLFQLLGSVDTFLLGRGMYPDYAKYWRDCLTNTSASDNERNFARLAEETPHLVFSKTIDKADPIAIGWKNTRIIKEDLATEINKLKQQPGKDMMLWGGARMASGFIRQRLIDECRILVNPVLLGGGKSLFSDIGERQYLTLLETRKFKSGAVELYYKSH